MMPRLFFGKICRGLRVSPATRVLEERRLAIYLANRTRVLYFGGSGQISATPSTPRHRRLLAQLALSPKSER